MISLAKLRSAEETRTKLLSYYQSSRGVGHTVMTLGGLQARGAVVAVNEAHAKFLRDEIQRRYPLTGEEASVITLDNLVSFVGDRRPIVLDNLTIQHLIQPRTELLDWIERAKEVLEDVRDFGSQIDNDEIGRARKLLEQVGE